MANRQRYCPDCRHPVSDPTVTDKQFNAQVAKHRGSAKCKAAMAHNEALGIGRNVDRLPYVVRFEATKQNLRVRLEAADTRVMPSGQKKVVKGSVWAEFKNFAFETRSLTTAMQLRDARNNGAHINPEQAELSATRMGVDDDGNPVQHQVLSENFHMHPDRFYEVGCFDPQTDERVDPTEFAATDVMLERLQSEPELATA